MSALPRAAPWLAGGVAAMTVLGCARTPPEQKLRESLSALQASMETRNASDLEDALAIDFVGPDGLDREGARRLAQMLFLRHQDIGANLGPVQITMQQKHASVRFTAALTGGTGAVLPDAASVYDVQTAWRLEDGEWRLINAQWTPRIQARSKKGAA